jgi:hypothetical protein
MARLKVSVISVGKTRKRTKKLYLTESTMRKRRRKQSSTPEQSNHQATTTNNNSSNLSIQHSF